MYILYVLCESIRSRIGHLPSISNQPTFEMICVTHSQSKKVESQRIKPVNPRISRMACRRDGRGFPDGLRSPKLRGKANVAEWPLVFYTSLSFCFIQVTFDYTIISLIIPLKWSSLSPQISMLPRHSTSQAKLPSSPAVREELDLKSLGGLQNRVQMYALLYPRSFSFSPFAASHMSIVSILDCHNL